MNVDNLKTVVFLSLLTALLVVVGHALGGDAGMVFAFGLAIVMNFGSYWFSDKIALAVNGAREIQENDDPELFSIVRQIVTRAHMPMPRVYVVNTASPNAFATGRNPEHAAIAVTSGIRQILTPYELTGVLSHEMAHVKNRDTLIAAVVATFAGAITMLAHVAQWGMILGGSGGRGRNNGGLIGTLFAILIAPLVATLIQLAISRSREFEADRTGARTIHDPEGLARALEKLEVGVARAPLQADPSMAHLFIVNPFGRLNVAGMFSTHPPIAERIARLRTMAADPSSLGTGN
jgi:heat shock protein HtpX